MDDDPANEAEKERETTYLLQSQANRERLLRAMENVVRGRDLIDIEDLRILTERLARDEAHPEEGLPWEEVKQEILRDLRASAVKR